MENEILRNPLHYPPRTITETQPAFEAEDTSAILEAINAQNKNQ